MDDGAVDENEVAGGAGRGDPLDLGSFPVDLDYILGTRYPHDISAATRNANEPLGQPIRLVAARHKRQAAIVGRRVFERKP